MGKQPVVTTTLSLSKAPPAMPDERRDGERFLTLYRVGSIRVGDRRELCLIKNVSAGGMRIRAYSTLDTGTEVEIELKSGQPVKGQVSWFQDRDAGIAFDQPIDVVDLLSNSFEGPRPRMPRIEVGGTVVLREGANVWRLQACDISQGGIKLRSSVYLELNANVVVTVPDLGPIAGVVCWIADDTIGVSFNKPIPLEQLVAWIRERHASKRRAC